MKLRSLLQPDWDLGKTIAELSIDELRKRHLKVLILDVDCTLIPPYQSKLPGSVKAWLKNARDHFTIHLFSNNPSGHHIGSLGKELETSFTTSASKPRSQILSKVLSEINVPARKVALIGDRLFTDTLAGNQLGLFTVLVTPIGVRSNQQLQKIERQLSCLLGTSIN
uniref:HAD-superfamily phosphatase subfamily IIIA n=1 Tax=Paulinella longichromatophora TaxID=1708747 RepID=A0A2H4ZP40_9EUKA|nr:HAD-superfamily phosphatase subfamily IIIA [Paulinella longichromatophora]